MKKVSFVLMGFLIFAFTQVGWAEGPKFPKQIAFYLIKGGKEMGKCNLNYAKISGGKKFGRQLYSLKLSNFEAMGYRAKVALQTYIFGDDLAAYLDSVLDNKNVISQIRFQKGTLMNGKKGFLFSYKEENRSGKIETQLFTKYKAISFISSFFVASQRVATGVHKNDELFNLLIDKSTKIVKMKYNGQKKVEFQGQQYKAEVILITNPNANDTEITRILIINSGGYFFPVSIFYTDPKKGSFEIRADKIK